VFGEEYKLFKQFYVRKHSGKWGMNVLCGLEWLGIRFYGHGNEPSGSIKSGAVRFSKSTQLHELGFITDGVNCSNIF
jgi:hypothetical protein